MTGWGGGEVECMPPRRRAGRGDRPASRPAAAGRLVLACALLAGAAGAGAAPADGQGYRGRLLTTGRYVQVRPLVKDTVLRTDVTVDEDGRTFFDGHPVVCVGERCSFYRAADVEHAVVLTQDVTATAWGFGVQGLSATLLLRGRADVGGAFEWPRSDDPFDALLAYAELTREDWRVRLGRQRTVSGLGFSGYDGVEGQYQALPWLLLEAYGGRSLARGLEEPRHEALEGIEPFLPDRNAWLLGGAVHAEPFAGTSAALRYQREIWSDRSALISERASLDVRTDALSPVALEGALDWDVAFGRVGKAHLRARTPLLDGRLVLEATARRYLPYFELWTIWGFFSPVGYREGELQARWVPRPHLSVWGGAGVREYEDHDAPVILIPLTDDARWLALGGRVGLPRGFGFTGSYRFEDGFGAWLSSGDASLSWRRGDRFGVDVHGTAFQQIQEFRIGEGVVLGGGVGADVAVTRRIRLSGGLDVYRQTFENRPSAVDWNQTRGWTSLEVTLGEDPGLGGRPR